jgi:hypothetical protein
LGQSVSLPLFPQPLPILIEIASVTFNLV